MPEQQLRFFDPARPLLERFGADFFRTIPRQPGVYFMFDHLDRVIYVGQSKNLRARLASYKYVYPERASRKTVRLVHNIQRITWEQCETVAAARLRENYLLRTIRPKFNSANTYPPAYFFVRMRSAPDELQLGLTRELAPDWINYGAFKSSCTAAYASLLRLLWASLHNIEQPHQFPFGFLGLRPPRLVSFGLPVKNGDPSLLHLAIAGYLSGENDGLISHLRDAVLKRSLERCLEALYLQDLELLTHFYQWGPGRHQKLRAQRAVSDGPIPPHELDDALVLLS